MKPRLAILLGLWAIATGRPALAGAPTEPALDVGVDEKLGQTVPLDIKLVDEQGDRVSLRDLIDKPTLLTLNYFRCVGLCTPLLNGVAEMLQKIDQTPGKDFQILTVSFDPRDDAELAGHKKENYIKQLGRAFPPTAWRFLTGDPISTKQLADSVGFKFAKSGEDFVHPGVVMVLSPTGMVTRYLYGVTFLPFDVKMAVTEAAQGRTGPTIARLLKFCFNYDPAGRRYSLAITRVSAAFTIMLAVGFGVVVGVTRRKRSKMGTLKGFAPPFGTPPATPSPSLPPSGTSGPAPSPPHPLATLAPSRSASPNPPAMVRGEQSSPAPHATKPDSKESS
jgi:protein SCO1/2